MAVGVVLTNSYTLSESSAFSPILFTSAKELRLALNRTLGGPHCWSGRLEGMRNI